MRFAKHPLFWILPGVVIALLIAGQIPNRSNPTSDHRLGQPERGDQAEQPRTEDAAASPKAPVPRDNRKAASTEKADCDGCNDHDNADLYEQRRMADAAEMQNRINIAGFVAIVLSLIFTGWAAYAASRAAQAAQKTVVVMEDTAERQLRAYVLAARAQLSDISVEGAPIQAHVIVENSGQTPAYEVRCAVKMALQQYPLPQPLELADASDAAPFVLRPRGEFNLLPQGRAMNAIERGLFAESKAAIFVYGEIAYQDAFKNQRRSTFRFIVGGHTAAKLGVDDKGQRFVAMAPDDEGNEAD